jgi:hypothetical protein
MEAQQGQQQVAGAAPLQDQQQQVPLQQAQQQMAFMMQQLSLTQLQTNATVTASSQPAQQQQQQQLRPGWTELWAKVGSALGAIMLAMERGDLATLLADPQAMRAMVETVLKQITGARDSEALMQQLVAAMTKG